MPNIGQEKKGRIEGLRKVRRKFILFVLVSAICWERLWNVSKYWCNAHLQNFLYDVCAILVCRAWYDALHQHDLKNITNKFLATRKCHLLVFYLSLLTRVIWSMYKHHKRVNFKKKLENLICFFLIFHSASFPCRKV